MDFTVNGPNLISRADWEYGAGQPEFLQVLIDNLTTGQPEGIYNNHDPIINFFTFTNLTVGNNYRVKVNSICGGVVHPGPQQTFIVPHPSTLRIGLPDTNPLVVLPNPSNGIINLYLDEKPILEGTVEIYTPDGVPVLDHSIEGSSFVDVSALQPGIYFMKVIYQGQDYYRKIIKVD